jgi:hypothetical protein
MVLMETVLDKAMARRRSKSARRIVAACALALACAVARAAEPFALAGHALGMPYDPVVKDSRYDCDSLAGCFLYSVCRYTGSRSREFAGAAIDRVSLYFQGERLSGIEGEFPAGEFNTVAGALSREYGAPAEEAATTGESAALTWRRGNQVLRIERHARPGHSSVILAERSFLGELLQR